MGLTRVPDDQIATIVTSLQMVAPPPRRPLPASPLRLQRWRTPTTDKYRILFRRIGEPWLWFSRLVMPDAELAAIIGDERVEVYAVLDRAGIEVGILELDFRTDATCELAFFGLVPELSGKGLGGWLMANALQLAWRSGITRVWVHTCTLDHPAALAFYRKQGFVPYARSIETFGDPRSAGLLPATAAPQIPLLAPPS